MLCAHQAIMSFQELIESFMERISLQKINDNVKDVVDCVLSKENITKMCLNVDSSSYIRDTKREMIKKPIEHIGSEIYAEIQRQMELKFELNFGPVLCCFPINCESEKVPGTLLNIVRSLNASPIKRILETALLPLCANGSSSLRLTNVVDEVYVMMLKNKENILEQLSNHINRKCKITSDHLEAICEQLECFRKRIDAINRRTREYLLKCTIFSQCTL